MKQLEIPNHIQMKIPNPVNFTANQIWSGDYSEPQAERLPGVTLLQRTLRLTAMANYSSCKMKLVTSLDTTPP